MRSHEWNLVTPPPGRKSSYGICKWAIWWRESTVRIWTQEQNVSLADTFSTWLGAVTGRPRATSLLSAVPQAEYQRRPSLRRQVAAPGRFRIGGRVPLLLCERVTSERGWPHLRVCRTAEVINKLPCISYPVLVSYYPFHPTTPDCSMCFDVGGG